jgi:hypothetical protein
MGDKGVFVWHDADGNITAVGYQAAASDKVIEPVASEDRSVLSLTVADEHLTELHRTHCIDVENATLIPRTKGSGAPRSSESASEGDYGAD